MIHKDIYLMFLSLEIDIKLISACITWPVYCTAIVWSSRCVFAEYDLFKPTTFIQNCIYMNFRIILNWHSFISISRDRNIREMFYMYSSTPKILRVHPLLPFIFPLQSLQTRYLYIVETFNMFQMNPKEFVHNTAYSVQLPYIAGLSL